MDLIVKDSGWKQLTTCQQIREIQLNLEITLSEIHELANQISASINNAHVTWTIGWPHRDYTVLHMHALIIKK